MFRKVLVGVDGHRGGHDAVALAKQLVADDGKIVLVHVYPVRGDPLHKDFADYEAAQYVHARDVLEAASDEAGADAELRRSASASPARGLHDLAEMLGSDLLVVGSCRRGLFGRVIVGNDTRAALDGAPCAVAIAPAGYAERPTPIRKVGVGYDGSPESERAIEVATALACELGASVSAIDVASLAAHAHETVDLLVVGSRGYGPVGRLLHESTSRALPNTARCPRLVLTHSTAVALVHRTPQNDRARVAT
jgi:nucleotide-binding universal stress UspA family protein